MKKLKMLLVAGAMLASGAFAVELPAGYTAVSCIESTKGGRQFIDTGYTANAQTKVVFEAFVPVRGEQEDQYGVLFGSRTMNDWTANAFALQMCKGNSGVDTVRFTYNGADRQDASKPFSYGERVTVTCDGQHIEWTGSKAASVAFTADALDHSKSTLYIFADNSVENGAKSKTGINHSVMRLYSFRITEGNTLKRNFVPCISPTGRTGLYDLVEGKFYPFSFGVEGAELECLVVPRGAYIDTKYKPNQNTRTMMDVTVQGKTEYWFGVSDVNYTTGAYGLLNDNDYGIYYAVNNSGGGFVSKSEKATTDGLVPNGRHTVGITPYSCLVDGEVWATKTPMGDFQLSNNLYLFASNDAANKNAYTREGQTSITCHGCTISENGVLVRDFVPWVNAQGTRGMFDRVGGKFYPLVNDTITADVRGIISILPAIAVTDGSYVDTSIRPDAKTRVTMDVLIDRGANPSQPKEYWFGCWDAQYNRGAFAFGNDGSGVYAGWGDQGGTFDAPIADGRHTVELDGNVVKVDDGETYRHEFNADFGYSGPLDHNLYLFAQNRNDTPFASSNQRIICMGCRIYRDGKLVRDFVPCYYFDYASLSSVYGLYDRVYRTFYPFKGDGRVSISTTLRYRWWNEDINDYATSYRECNFITSIMGSTLADEGWYAAVGNVTLNNGLTLTDEAHLVLTDGSRLEINAQDRAAGIRVRCMSNDDDLYIYDQEGGTGTLIARGGRYAAGIGGDDEQVPAYDGAEEDCGNIYIHGGRIEAYGGTCAAGIGGGDGYGDGDGGDVTIYGGTVTALGGSEGVAGIGPGLGGDSGTLVLNRVKDIFAGDAAPGSRVSAYGQNLRYVRIETKEVFKYRAFDVEAGGFKDERCVDYEIITPETTTLKKNHWYVVKGDVTVSHGLRLEAGHVHLILLDGSRLEVFGKDYEPGIRVRNQNSGNDKLHIYGQVKGTGKLIAHGGQNAAGIGGDSEWNAPDNEGDEDCGDIWIHGGEIEAYGGANAAGIGGGFGLRVETTVTCPDGNGGEVTIYGGRVKAVGGYEGAGIGGGSGHTVYYTVAGEYISYYDFFESGSLTVLGGEVTAIGGVNGAGIGGGAGGYGAEVSISGGKVTAQGGTNAAGIGGGFKQYGNDVTISGGEVIATGGAYGAGIGNGKESGGRYVGMISPGNVVITGGAVSAHAGITSEASSRGEDIGLGGENKEEAVCSDVEISGGLFGMPVKEAWLKEGYAVYPNCESKTAQDYPTCVSSGSFVEYTVPQEYFNVTLETSEKQTYVSRDGKIYVPYWTSGITIRFTPVPEYELVSGETEVEIPIASESKTIAGPEVRHRLVEYVDGEGCLQSNDTFSIVTAATRTLGEGWWLVEGDDVTCYSLEVPDHCTANLILADGASLTALGGKVREAGIQVGPSSALNIFAQRDGTGCLTAMGEGAGAGIGGDQFQACGQVTICGGTVTAMGGEYGAGIGGGYDAPGGVVTIYGGRVTALRGLLAEDIGQGAPSSGPLNPGSCGTIQISGGIFGMALKNTWMADNYFGVENPDPETREDYPFAVVLGKIVTLEGFEQASAVWTSGDGSATNVVENAHFAVLKGTDNVKVIFTSDLGYAFADGAVTAEVSVGRVDADCKLTVPEVRKSETDIFGFGWFVTAQNGVYVDSLFTPDSNTHVEMDVLVGDTSKREYWFGCWDVNWNDGAFALGNDGNEVYRGYGSDSATCGGVKGLGAISSGRVTVALEKGIVYTNGVSWSGGQQSDAVFALEHNLYLFAQNRAGFMKPGDGQERIVCYGCRIWTNGVNGAAVPVRNFVPARTKDERQIVGLYDTVSGEFYVPRGGTLTLGYDGPTCEGGTIEWSDAANAWVVTPNAGVTEVTVANLPAGAIVAVPPSVTKVSGVADAQIKVRSGAVDITGAFTVAGGAIALNENGSVTIGGETIPVKPVIGDWDEGEAFVVGEGSVTVTVRTIPGLKYELMRGVKIGSGGIIDPALPGDPVVATGTTVTLTDAEPPEGKAFYRIKVSVP